jgi:hypothetical protein
MEADRNATSVGSGRKLSRRKMVSRSVGGSTVSATSARPPRGRDRPLLGQGAEQFGDEQRVARRPRDLSQEPRARLGSDGLGHQAGHRLPGKGAQNQMAGADSLQRPGQPVQLSGLVGGPEARDEAHRQIVQTAA